MTIDFMASLNNAGQYAFSSSLLNGLVGNPIMLALIISVIILLIIMIMYPAKKNAGCFVLVKIFIYTFILSSAVIFLHDGVLKYHYKDKADSDIADGVLGGLTLGGQDPVYEYYPTMNTMPARPEPRPEPPRPEPFTSLTGPKPPPQPNNPFM